MNKTYKILLVSLVVMSVLLTACGGQNNASNQDQRQSADNNGESQPAIDFPSQTITIIAPYAPGGSIDTVARTLAEAVPKYLPKNVSVVVENKTGGGGTIGTTELIRSDADGYTLAVLPNGPVVISPHMGTTSYSLDDLLPVMRVSNIPQVLLVQPNDAWKTFDEWLDYVKANPDVFTTGTSGTGTTAHFALEAVNYTAGIKMKHVPFDGSSSAINALMGGHVDGVILEGRKVADGVDLQAMFTTGPSDAYPDATVLSDKGIEVKADVFNGIFAPKDTPREIVDILHDAFKKTIEDPKVIETLTNNGIMISYLGPDDFKKALEEESERNKVIVENTGLKQQ